MFKTFLQACNRLFNEDTRGSRAKKNILASLILKGGNILIGFYLVPLTLNYLNPTKYGIWLTLSSIIAWFSFFDIGLGNGLRNKFAEAVAKGNEKLARIYVSTTYAVMTIIISLMMLLFIGLKPFLDWTVILNAPKELKEELTLLVIYAFSFFCLQFVLKLITTIVTADQKPAIKNLAIFISQALSLIIILTLVKTTAGSLLYLGIAMTLSPVVVLAIFNMVLFSTTYKKYAPSFQLIDLKYTKQLISLGFQFFAIQVSAIILFTTDNLIITQVLGPSEVTAYNIAYKYFGVGSMIFAIIISPFWSAFTEAWVKKDITWIKKVVKKLLFIWLGLLGMSAIMLIFSSSFYKLWIGTKVTIPFSLSLWMAVFFVLQSLNTIFVHFINGVGKLRIQLLTGIYAVFLNIPVSIYLAKNLNLGSKGVIIATIISTVMSVFLHTVQYHKIINNTATGLWNK